MPKGHYDPKTKAAIDKYGSGSYLRSQSQSGIAKDRNGLPYSDPELSYSANARNNVGSFVQGEASRDLKRTNPDLTDYGVSQTMKNGARLNGDQYSPIDSYKKGTPFVPRTGLYKLHRGEAVVPASKNKKRSAFFGE